MTARKSVKKSEQPMMPGRNGGQLRRGSLPGNTAGSGRPSNAIRGTFREILAQSLDMLSDHAQGRVVLTMVETCPECGHQADSKAPPMVPRGADTLRAIEIAAKYGLHQTMDKGLVDELWEAVAAQVDEDELPRIKKAWNKIVGRRLVELVT